MLNLVIVTGMLITTVYRAWMEKQNLEARQKIMELTMILNKEAELIKEMSGEEFIDMLKVVLEK